jgi:hypothetical protein
MTALTSTLSQLLAPVQIHNILKYSAYYLLIEIGLIGMQFALVLGGNFNNFLEVLIKYFLHPITILLIIMEPLLYGTSRALRMQYQPIEEAPKRLLSIAFIGSIAFMILGNMRSFMGADPIVLLPEEIAQLRTFSIMRLVMIVVTGVLTVVGFIIIRLILLSISFRFGYALYKIYFKKA